ncbi:DUF4139 domain-containing protein [Orrella dioscoreae]|uniref:DUF4139 domain-containing protein n=1 Tax=Orrella dioscoreae TaxID=1851544 RepID=A0A1C3K1J9_9BURK|nr:DUF4139 domain-containing protein [Orrella dioscoreae]SBT25257.1 hypothetical protein ODI_01572 [Orrella dioscoreae]SOE49006.1 hypothetical protein ODI_R1782 [Orrella dioscoreae]
MSTILRPSLRPLCRALALAALPGAMIWTVPATAQDQPEARIHAITLSSGGVAEVQRRVEWSAPGSLRIEVPLAQVDDVLKSLVVRDPKGTVGGMTLDGLSPVDETFGRLPFSQQDMASIAGLAAALQGVPASASSGGRTVQGRILGVAQADGGTAAEPRVEHILSMMSESGQVQSLRLGPDATLDIQDDTLRKRIADAARISGQARADGVRTISIALAGEGKRDVGISYVVAAPVWKASYRLVSGHEPGKARLQAWAVVENATAEDWQGVTLTLAAGAPVLLAQRLHQRYWHARQDVPVAAGAAEAPPTDDYAEMMADAAGPGSQAMAEAAPPPAPAPAAMARAQGGMGRPAPAPVARAAATAAAQEGEISASYRLPLPVDLPAGKTLSVPFLDVALPAERLSVYRAGRASRHPVAAISLDNTSQGSLPAGLLTVYDARDGHVGDAQLSGLPAGESRLASFAEDRKVTITTNRERGEPITEVTLADGLLQVRRLSRESTTYTVQGAADAPRTVLIEHPRVSGWTFASPSLVGQTATHHRLKLSLKAGENGKIDTVAERPVSQRYALLDLDAPTLLSWSGRALDAAAAARLKTLAERRATVAQAEQRLAQAVQAVEQAEANQSRVRENLGAVAADSELGQRYARMLAQEEDRIAALQQAQAKANDAVEQAKRSLVEALKA